jgi:hypothetical protein
MSLKEKLSKLFSENTQLAEEFMHHWNTAKLPDTYEFMSVSHERVDSYGGEDCGSTYYSVYKFTENYEPIYIKFNGWYASHYGSEYRDFEFVTPQQRTITVYE